MTFRTSLRISFPPRTPRHDVGHDLGHDAGPPVSVEVRLRILGVDPGTLCAGWGVVEHHGNRIQGVDAGAFKLGSKRPLAERLLRLEEGLVGVLQNTQPDVVAIEEVFFAKHPNAALKLGHARGVVMLVAAKHGLPIHEYAPAAIKQTVAGRGAADKVQVARLVAAILGWQDRLAGMENDASDALAVAITHCQARLFPRAQKPKSSRRPVKAVPFITRS